MALAKDRKPNDSHMGLVQTCSHYSTVFGDQISDQSSPELYLSDDHHNLVNEDNETPEKAIGFFNDFTTSHHSSSLPSTPSSTNSSGYIYGVATNYPHPHEEAHSAINYKSGYNPLMHSSCSFLTFEQTDHSPKNWEDNPIFHGFNSCNLLQEFNSVDGSTVQEFRTQELALYKKRPHMGGSMEGTKRQCTSGTRKSKPKSTPSSKDPQSIAAKNRRERISERLKTLQELVPNGSKVDLVTMLEKAIGYVKFLQLQVKVLATDEFWPVQGGKAPDISQVKEAIDAILSSHKDKL